MLGYRTYNQVINGAYYGIITNTLFHLNLLHLSFNAVFAGKNKGFSLYSCNISRRLFCLFHLVRIEDYEYCQQCPCLKHVFWCNYFISY